MTDDPDTFVCTKQQPWTPGVTKPLVLHPDATPNDHDIVCPHCGTWWPKLLFGVRIKTELEE